MGTGSLSGLSAQFSQSTEQEKSTISAQFLREVSLGVTVGSNSLVDH